MKEDNPTHEAFVKIDGNKVSYGIHFHYVQQDGFFNAYIPGFDLSFCTQDREKLKERATQISTAYLRYFLNKEGMKRFALEMHKKGFIATNHHDKVMSDIMHNKSVNTKFKNYNNNLPLFFNSSHIEELSDELEFAS
jgi:hypothetical protein